MSSKLLWIICTSLLTLKHLLSTRATLPPSAQFLGKFSMIQYFIHSCLTLIFFLFFKVPKPFVFRSLCLTDGSLYVIKDFIKGAFQKSELAGQTIAGTSHFDNEKCFFPIAFVETPFPLCPLFGI